MKEAIYDVQLTGSKRTCSPETWGNTGFSRDLSPLLGLDLYEEGKTLEDLSDLDHHEKSVHRKMRE